MVIKTRLVKLFKFVVYSEIKWYGIFEDFQGFRSTRSSPENIGTDRSNRVKEDEEII